MRRSNSRNLARSDNSSGASSAPWAARYFFTQPPTVVSFSPYSRATSAIDRSDSTISFAISVETQAVSRCISQTIPINLSGSNPIWSAVRFAERTSVRLAELAGEPFLTFPRHRVSRLYDHIAALCHHAGFRLEIAQEAVQFPTLLGLAAANTGVTIVPASLRALNLAELRYVELADPEATSTLSIAYRADRQPPATVRDFLDITSAIDIP